MILNDLHSLIFSAGVLLIFSMGGMTVSHAQEPAAGKSFVENFDNLGKKRWYVSDGWSNGDHQNCIWSKDQVKISDGTLLLGFAKQKLKDRDYVCGEVQTKQRFGYGTYEARIKTDTGSGLNAAFFTFIGPMDKQPHDEIDFEVLTKDTSRVQLNAYASAKGGNEKLVPVSDGTDKAYNDYAIVWEEGRIRWFVNGELTHTLAAPAQLPSHPQKIFFSLWGSDTLTGWMGPFVDPGRKITMEVDRVAFTVLGQPCQFPESVACSLH